MGFSVKGLGFFDIVDFNALYQKSFSEFKSELEKCGYAYKNIDQKYIFDNYIYTCIADKSIVLLYDNDNLIGYEFMYICPDNKSIITMAYTYIVNEYRGKKLSYLLNSRPCLSGILRQNLCRLSDRQHHVLAVFFPWP